MTRILVIDDEELVRETLLVALETHGYDVFEAVDGEDGMRRFDECSPDLVITDLIMPKKDGLEVIAEIKERSPETRIIAISGGSRLSNTSPLDLAAELGADAVLKKPFSLQDILETVAELTPK